MTTIAQVEILAVQLYESDCRARAGEVAKNSTLSRIRPYHGFPRWTDAPRPIRDYWRCEARKMLKEHTAWVQEEEAWA